VHSSLVLILVVSNEQLAADGHGEEQSAEIASAPGITTNRLYCHGLYSMRYPPKCATWNYWPARSIQDAARKVSVTSFILRESRVHPLSR
jgi:hypothetical protein